MEMKDKLVKVHRTGYYYKFKQIGIMISCAFALIAIVGVPTYITLSAHEKESISKAENIEEKDDNQKLDSFENLQ